MNKLKKETGFTIIEVVLVLAIAGLIFLMVFIALPALQRSQRDTQRKNDIGRALTALNSYAANNRGAVPAQTAAATNAFVTGYLTVNNDTFVDPSGQGSVVPGVANAYAFDVSGAATGALNAGFTNATQNVIYYAVGRVCNTGGGNLAPTAAGSRKVTMRIYLEGGGVFCQNN